MKKITKQDLERLSELSLISIKEEKKEKMLIDLEKILGYFSLLQEVETEQVLPSFSGHSEDLIDKFSEKKDRVDSKFLQNSKNGYIKGPKIF